MIIGITGKSGSGKTTLARQIQEEKRGVHIDVDKIAHKVLLKDEVKEELVKIYGKKIIQMNEVERKYLREMVFQSRNEMKRLSSVIWNYMEAEIDNIINNNKDKIIIIDWILLPKTKYFNNCDIKILIDIPYSIRKDRVLKRDQIEEDIFILREKSSISYQNNEFDFILNDISIEKNKKVGETIMKRVLYPGSFDPITKGHMNIIEEASYLFDEVIVGILENPMKKNKMFTLDERLEMIDELYKNSNNIIVISSTQSAVDVALEYECQAIIRGIRNFLDYDYELALQEINRELSNDKINVVFECPISIKIIFFLIKKSI